MFVPTQGDDKERACAEIGSKETDGGWMSRFSNDVILSCLEVLMKLKLDIKFSI